LFRALAKGANHGARFDRGTRLSAVNGIFLAILKPKDTFLFMTFFLSAW
jgi:hypothetical protein